MPESRKIYRLEEVAKIKYGKDHKKLEEGTIPCYGTGGVMRFVDKYLSNEESVLIPRKGSLNNLYYIDKPFWTVDTLFWTQIDSSKILPKYLYYNFKTIDFASKDVGSAVPSLTTSLLNEVELNLPPLPEQKAIASILSALDDKIELNLQMNKTLEEMAMTLYKHWFVDFGPFQDGKFIDSELGEIPKGWEVKSVGELGVVKTGKTPSKKFPEHFGEDISFVTPSDFKNYGKHITNAIRGISESGALKHKNSLIPENSVIVTCIGSDMGKVSLNKVICLTNQQINSLITNDYLFMYCFFKSSYEQLRMLAGDGTTMPIINKSSFENIKVITPIDSVLTKFNNEVKYWDEQMHVNTLENQTLTQIRDTLLPKLISGEVRVKQAVAQIQSLI